MKAIACTLSITWKEIQLILKDIGSLAIFFVLPLFLIVMLGGVNLQAAKAETSILLDVCLVNQDSGTFGRNLARALIKDVDVLRVETCTSVAASEAQVAQGNKKAAIIIPAAFTKDIGNYKPTALELVVDPGDPDAASIVRGIMNEAASEVIIWGEVQHGINTVLDESGAFTRANDQLRQGMEAQTLGVIMTTLDDMRRTPAIDVVTEDLTGAKVTGGIGVIFALMFPGFAVMFIFLTVNWSSSSLLREREAGTLRRLLAAPVPRGAIIAGNMLAFMLLSCMQVVVLFGVGNAFFKMPLGQSPGGLMALTLVVALTSTALGMLVAALARSSSQAASIGLILGFIMAGVAGCIGVLARVPLVRTEGLLGLLAKLTPHGHALDAYYSLMVEKATLVQVLPQMGILLAMSLAFFLVAQWRFRFE
jgi:ABC-2 type transport system permease protein